MKKWKLVWNGEDIENDIDSLETARYLKHEYELAYKGTVTIKRDR